MIRTTWNVSVREMENGYVVESDCVGNKIFPHGSEHQMFKELIDSFFNSVYRKNDFSVVPNPMEELMKMYGGEQ